MRRPNPALDADDALLSWERSRSTTEIASLTVKCRLSTPMYGGGVRPGEVDRQLPIRPSAIRGQLRYWWRLLNGSGKSSQELFAAEAELWGGISRAGPHASRVILHVRSKPIQSGDMVDASKTEFPRYAFILERKKALPRLLHDGYRFELILHFTDDVTDDQRRQVIQALRWWVSFGGVGARTRRGLGAIHAIGSDCDLTPVSCKDVQSKGGRMLLQGPSEDAISAWKSAVEALSDFRQGVPPGHSQRRKSRRRGRSPWPEADVIRRLKGRKTPKHKPMSPTGDIFPRAAFGLPIVFHFKDRRDPQEQLTLIPSVGDRMSSPLILRPYFKEERFHPLALLLPGWEKCVSIKVSFGDKHERLAWPELPQDREKLANEIAPMKDRDTDVLTAFMHYFEHECGQHGVRSDPRQEERR